MFVFEILDVSDKMNEGGERLLPLSVSLMVGKAWESR